MSTAAVVVVARPLKADVFVIHLFVAAVADVCLLLLDAAAACYHHRISLDCLLIEVEHDFRYHRFVTRVTYGEDAPGT